MLQNNNRLLKAASHYQYGQAAFNINTISQAKALIEIHEMLRAPLIIQVADLGLGFLGGQQEFKQSTLKDKEKGAQIIAYAVKEMAEKSPIPIALHLDHGSSFETCKAAIDNGFTSVMFDGSHFDYEENVRLTRQVVDYAHPRGVSVEGELGILAGVEDDVFSETSTYTNPLQALDFIKRTNVDSLAISYGTTHGPNKGKNVSLRTEIVIAISELLRHEQKFCSIVSHGSSTIPEYIVSAINHLGGEIEGAGGIARSVLQETIVAGVNKINVDTDLRLAMMRNFWELLKHKAEITDVRVKAMLEKIEENPKEVDPRRVMATIMDYAMTNQIDSEDLAKINDCMTQGVKEIVAQLIVSFEMVGKAEKVVALENANK